MDLAEILQIPTNKLDMFVRTVDVSSYLPGRTRLYSKRLINNEELKQKIENMLGAFPEINELEINTLSGSILILYDVEKLRKNKDLRKVEEYIATHARRKQP